LFRYNLFRLRRQRKDEYFIAFLDILQGISGKNMVKMFFNALPDRFNMDLFVQWYILSEAESKTSFIAHFIQELPYS
jgi:hypothetical protein